MMPMLFCRSASRRMPSTFARRRRLGAAHAALVDAHVARAGSRSPRCRPPRRPRGRADRPSPGRSARSPRIAARARATSVVDDSACSSGGDRSCRRHATAHRHDPFSRGGTPSYVDRNLDPHRLLARVLLQHFGGQPGDAADDEQEACPPVAGSPRSWRMAASAPSMFIGSGLMRSRPPLRARAHEADAVAGQPDLRRAMSKSTSTRGSIVEWTRWPRPGSRRLSPTALFDRPAARACVERQPSRCRARRGRPRSAPCSPRRRRRARRRWPGRRRRPRPTSDWRLPDAARRAAAQDGAPAPWSATRSGWRRAAAARPATAAARDAAGRSGR